MMMTGSIYERVGRLLAEASACGLSLRVHHGRLQGVSKKATNRSLLQRLGDCREEIIAELQRHSAPSEAYENGAQDNASGIAQTDSFQDNFSTCAPTDEQNAAAVLGGITDRFCLCKTIATVAIGRRKRTETTLEGVERWYCDVCFALEYSE